MDLAGGYKAGESFCEIFVVARMTANTFQQECDELATLVRRHFDANLLEGDPDGFGKNEIIGWISDHLDGVKKAIKRGFMFGHRETRYTTHYDRNRGRRLMDVHVQQILFLLPKILGSDLTFECLRLDDWEFVISIKWT